MDVGNIMSYGYNLRNDADGITVVLDNRYWLHRCSSDIHGPAYHAYRMTVADALLEIGTSPSAAIM